MTKKLLAAALLTLCAVPSRAAVYQLDPEHSTVMFTVRHLVGHVTGSFDKFAGTFEYDPKDPSVWKTSATIDASSVDTKVEARDKHLRSEDFFDVAEYPTLSFVSTKVKMGKGHTAKLFGKLTIRGVTKPVALDLEIDGVEKDANNKERAAFTATTKIDRKDFGLTWNDFVESGGALVGDDVTITIEAEGVRQ